MINPIFAIDGYKTSHRQQYPEGTTLVYSNFTPRSNKRFKTPVMRDAPLLFMGLQPFLVEWLQNQFNKEFFDKDKKTIVAEYKEFMDNYIGKDMVPVDNIAALHDLGYLPLEIKALPEGTLVKAGTPVFTIKNTKPEFFWLVNYLESFISAEVWPVTTAATIAFNYRSICEKFAKITCDNTDHIPWQCHDFSFRGDMGMYGSTLVGMGHLASFKGTDGIPAMIRLKQSYNASEELVGGSIPATEHSVMCMGTKENEIETFSRLLDLYPTGIFSAVSDSWDYWNVLGNYLPKLKRKILSRDGKLVIRPDSGDPVEIICGIDYYTPEYAEDLETATDEAKDYLVELVDQDTPHGELGDDSPSIIFKFEDKYYNLVLDIFWNRYDKQYYYIEESKIESCDELKLTNEQKGSIETLWDLFGGTINSKGYKVLDPHIGLIYGDSITLERANSILSKLERKGFAASNVVFGIGSFTYQYNTRDTFGFAMKATYGEVNGVGREIFKSPKTDSGEKKSHKGLIAFSKIREGVWDYKDQATPEEEANSDLPVVFKNGKLCNNITLTELRSNINNHFKV